MGKNSIVEMIKERFSKYKTYYEILQINPNDATDEKVKISYENKLKEFNAFFSENNDDEKKQVMEIIETTLMDAYTALKTEHSRNNYNDLLKRVNEKNKIDEENQL